MSNKIYILCPIIVFSFLLCSSYISKKNLINIFAKSKNSYYYPYSIPNRNYLNLVRESYNHIPDINYMLKYLKIISKNMTIHPFYIIDSIRLLSKSIRLQKFSKVLSRKDGDVTYYYDQMFIYRNTISKTNHLHKVKTVCEIGFHIGAGALLLLTSLNDDLIYYGFDLGLNFSKAAYNVISKYFNMNMEWGKSENTVPNIKQILCNIIHIDGDHSQNVIYNDIVNMKRLSNKNTIIFLDDVNINSKAIVKARKKGIINDVECFFWKPFCICQYII